MAVRRDGRAGRWLVIGPPLVYLLVFFAAPTLLMVLASFRTPAEFGGLAPLVDDSGQGRPQPRVVGALRHRVRLRADLREVRRLRGRDDASCACCSPIRSRR